MIALYLGEQGPVVQYLQLALTRAGYPTTIDGDFGQETCSSLRTFQTKNGITEECAVKNGTWRALAPYLKGYTRHVVQPGDTYFELAETYRSTVPKIRAANPSSQTERLQVGTVINIPFDFPLVPTNVPYSAVLNRYVVEGLAVRYPFLTQGSIGQSVMGRQIPYLRMGNGSKEVFYNASFHANEWITTPVLLKFAEDFAEAYVQGKTIGGVPAEQLLTRYALYLVPMVNPDGVDLVTGMPIDELYYKRAEQIAGNYPKIPFPDGWKANIAGVDLNLQFPAGWENAKEIKYQQGYTTPAPRDYVGEAPLSAPESRAVYDFTMGHAFALILAYHTQGEVIYWKYLNYEPERSREIAYYFSEVSGYQVEETPYASGFAGYKDWFIEHYNRPGYTIEAGMGENPLPLSQFDKIYRDNIGILVGGMTQS